MKSVNKATLLGNVGNDPEVRVTGNGVKVASLSLATSRQWTSASGEKQEKTEWHKLVVWNRGTKGGLADVVERYVTKGAKLYVEGGIEYRQWEKDGEKKWTTEINVTDLVMLGGDKADKPVAAKPKAAPGFDTFPDEVADDDSLPF